MVRYLWCIALNVSFPLKIFAPVPSFNKLPVVGWSGNECKERWNGRALLKYFSKCLRWMSINFMKEMWRLLNIFIISCFCIGHHSGQWMCNMFLIYTAEHWHESLGVISGPKLNISHGVQGIVLLGRREVAFSNSLWLVRCRIKCRCVQGVSQCKNVCLIGHLRFFQPPLIVLPRSRSCSVCALDSSWASASYQRNQALMQICTYHPLTEWSRGCSFHMEGPEGPPLCSEPPCSPTLIIY